ncbi:hypothetical protein U9M48_005729 [Paspalum notatum var. saurae]|uniref:Uncharacterized protein n=1 Tax=Paspalum notatum var. saurae TaxID=547442 RepID=A0AAQ3PQR6_PASNO
MADVLPQMTPMSTSTMLDKDEDGKEVDQKVYRGMIGSLLYLTAMRPDIQFAIGLCARFQTSPRESHRTTVKWILRPQVYFWHLSVFGYLSSLLVFSTKHIDVRYHFLRDNYEKGIIDIVKVVGKGVDKALIKGEIEGLK